MMMADVGSCFLNFILVSGLIVMCYTYNVDVNHVRVLTGPENTLFGYTSTFQSTNSGLRLIVGAPKDKAPGSPRSGAIYSCDVTETPTCEQNYYSRGDDVSVTGVSFTDSEMYGAFIIQTNQNTLLACAPRYNDLTYEQEKYAFLVGRCTLNGTQEVRPLFKSRAQDYLREVEYLEGFKKTIYYKGMGQAGLSGDDLPDGSILLGMPGFKEWRGGVLILDELNNANNFETPLSVPEFSYYGYAIVSGKFCGNSCFAVGGPRKASGEVKLYDVKQGEQQTLYGDQTGSYFGASLCAADVNGDGLDDLLVGAPFYASEDDGSDYTKKKYVDEGRVILYLNTWEPQKKEIFVKHAVLKGSNIHSSRFGTAITNLGDINKDGYEDVAIGAPYEDDGRGAVYIYQGDENGLKQEIKQKILARDLNDTLTSFGWSISKPADIDSNNYPDFVVGAHLSSQAIVLRTRPVVNVQVDLTTDPQLILRNQSLCPINANSDGCFRLKICFRYTGVSLPRNLAFNYTIDVDTRKSRDQRRVRLANGTEWTDTVSGTAIANNITGFCAEFQAKSIDTLRDKDPFTVVRLEADYNLLQPADPDSDIQPITNLDQPRRVIKDIAYQLGCGDDNVCSSDLVLKAFARVDHGNTVVREALKKDIVINATRTTILDVAVENKGEDAFATVIFVTWTGSLTFQTTLSETVLICNDKSEEVGSNSGKVECNVLRPVKQNSKFGFNMFFLADDITPDRKTVDFHITIQTESVETAPNDNVYNISTQVWIDADVVVGGKTKPEQVVMSAEGSEKSVKLLHNYVITNKGPSYLPSTEVRVRVPYYQKPDDSTQVPGSQLVKDVVVVLKQEDSYLECIPSSESEASGQNISTSPVPATTPQVSEPGQRETTTSFLPVVKPSKLRNSPSNNIEQGTDNVFIMDCDSYLCEDYVCSLNNLGPSQSAILDMRVELPEENIPVEYFKDIDYLLYQTMVKVKEPRHPLFYQWQEARDFHVGTRIYPEIGQESVSIWIIAVSVIGGILLLIIIFIVLYKVGFFKREKKGKIQKWKRESGYYQRNAPRGNRQSQAPRQSALPEEDKAKST